jgi:membrane fusion protein, multidrug efflux system
MTTQPLPQPMETDCSMGVHGRSQPRLKPIHRVGLLLGTGMAAIALGLSWLRAEPAGSLPTSQSVPAIPVQTAVVEPQTVKVTQIGLGTVIAWKTATITPQVSGQVIGLPFKEGSLVQQESVLVRIDPRPFQAALDQAKAKKSQDEASLEAAEKNLARDETLLAKGGFATQQTVDNERAQVDAFKAMIEGDQAAIEAAQINLEFATIKAPFTGVVGLRSIDTGNVVTTGSNIVTLTQVEPIAVDFSLPQSNLSEVQAATAQGKPPVLAFDQDGTTQLARGILDVINNEVDPATGTIKLKARFDNKDHKLWPGAFVQVRVITTTEPNAIAVLSQAVQRGPNGLYVWLVSSDQSARMQPVELGQIQNGRTVIASGLQAGDRIVIAGQYRLTEGARVSETDPEQVANTRGSQP